MSDVSTQMVSTRRRRYEFQIAEDVPAAENCVVAGVGSPCVGYGLPL